MKKQILLICFLLFFLVGCTPEKKPVQEHPIKQTDKIILPKQIDSLNSVFSKDKDNNIYFASKNHIYYFLENNNSPKLQVLYTEKNNFKRFQSVKIYNEVLYALITDYTNDSIVGTTGLYYYNSSTKEFTLIYEFDKWIVGMYMHFFNGYIYIEEANYNDYSSNIVQYDLETNHHIKKVKQFDGSKLINEFKNTIEKQNNVNIKSDFYLKNFAGNYFYCSDGTKYLFCSNSFTSSEVKQVIIEPTISCIDIVGNYVYVQTVERKVYRFDLDLSNQIEILNIQQ